MVKTTSSSKKTPSKKTVSKTASKPVKSPTPSAKTQNVDFKTRLKKYIPPVFSDEMTREDKLCLFSFCLGMIVMACFFIIDFQIRSYIDTRNWERKIMYTMQQNMRTHQNFHRIPSQTVPARTQHHTRTVTPACPSVWERKAAFIESDYAPYAQPGSLKLTGNVCKSLPKGAKCPAQMDVFVNPVTTYSKEWWSKHWAGPYNITPADSRALTYNIHTKSDEHGRFKFKNLPAGNYYVGSSACIEFNPGKPCVMARLGKQIKLNKDSKIMLDIVYPAKKN